MTDETNDNEESKIDMTNGISYTERKDRKLILIDRRMDGKSKSVMNRRKFIERNKDAIRKSLIDNMTGISGTGDKDDD